MTFNDLYPTMSWYNAPAEMQVDTEKELLIVTTKKRHGLLATNTLWF